jgi:hypothetical protein
MHTDILLDKAAFELIDLNDSSILPIRNLDSRYFIEKTYYATQRQMLVVEFVRNVFQQGHHYSLILGFRGALKDDNAGFYKSSYSDSRGTKRWLMVSFINIYKNII